MLINFVSIFYKKVKKSNLDYSTFTQSLAQNEIEIVKNIIKDMYRIKYVYTLKEIIKNVKNLYLLIIFSNFTS